MQGNKLFIGNLNYSVDKTQLEKLFSKYGKVIEAKIIEGKGFGFIEMNNQAEAQKAKEELNGYFLEGRNLKIEEAKPPRAKHRKPFRRY